MPTSYLDSRKSGERPPYQTHVPVNLKEADLILRQQEIR
jgi:hypothetical protein